MFKERQAILMQRSIRKKVCILGAAAVGKTSLVAGYTGGEFSPKYQPTLGVWITRTTVVINERLRELIVWDIKGESEFYRIPSAYLYASDGYVLVADGTSRSSWEHALELHTRMQAMCGDIPHVLVCNKADLEHAWEFDATVLASLRAKIPNVFVCSARSGDGLVEALVTLGHAMWGGK